jgi:hypothetical protein
MPSSLRILLCSGIVIAFMSEAGCQSDPEATEVVMPAALPLDPMDKYELSPWWSNGTLLLHLDPFGGYTLYPSNNRYQDPLERGSWDHASYAALWLRPYSRMDQPDTRATITRIEGELVMLLGDGPPLHPDDAPPAVIEDQLIGTWDGGTGSLAIRRDGRFVFSPAARNGSLAAVVAYQGRWRVVNDRLVLTPSNGRPPVEIEMVREGATIRLDWPTVGQLEKAQR